jgi:hypothetical protein
MHSAIANVFHIKDIKVINKNFLIPQSYPIPTANAIFIDDNKIMIIYALKEPPTRASSVGGLLLMMTEQI